MIYTYNCTKPKESSNEDWPDCKRCFVAHCGYSKNLEPNPKWEEQEGICKYEHCIESMPLPPQVNRKD